MCVCVFVCENKTSVSSLTAEVDGLCKLVGCVLLDVFVCGEQPNIRNDICEMLMVRVHELARQKRCEVGLR